MASNNRTRSVGCLIVTIICVLLTPGVFKAQSDEYNRWINGVSEPWFFDPTPMTKDEIAVSKARWQSIEVENKNSVVDEWAGDYFVGGDTHGSYLRWSPESGFVMMNVDKCRATVMSLDYGKVIASNTLVQLFPELNKKTSGHGHAHVRAMPLNFVRVKWYGDRYLVSADRIAEFGDYVAGLGKYNDKFSFFVDGIEFFIKMNDADEESKTQFLPIMPAGYERFIKQPIDAIITGVGRGYVRHDPENDWWDNLILPVTLNVGKADGAKRGMNLVLLNSDRMEMIEIRKVGLRSASGVIVRSTRKLPCVKYDKTDDCKDPEYETILIGKRVSTSPFRK